MVAVLRVEGVPAHSRGWNQMISKFSTVSHPVALSVCGKAQEGFQEWLWR